MIQKYLETFKTNTYELKTEKISQDETALTLVENLINTRGKKLLIAPPSTGKTYSMFKLVEKGYKIIFLTHTQDLAKQTALAYKKYFNEDCQLLCEKNFWRDNVTNNFIVSVWDSILKMNITDEEKSMYKIIIDEAHNTIQTLGYREKGTKYLFDFIEGRDCTYITATPLSLTSGEFSNILFINKQNTESVFLVDRANKSYASIINQITNEAKGKVLCLLNSKNRGITIDKTLSEIEDNNKNISLISTDNEENRKYIQENSMLISDLTITTEVLCDGVNILNTDVSDVIVICNNINYNHIIQFIRRCRLVTPNIWIITKKDDECDFTWDIADWKPIRNLVKKMLVSENYLNKNGNIDREKHNALRKAYQKYYSQYATIIEKDNKYEMKPNINNIRYEFYFIHHKMLYKNIKTLLEFYSYKIIEKSADDLFNTEIEEVKIERKKFSELSDNVVFNLLYQDIVAKHNENNSNKIVQDLSVDEIQMLSMYKRDISTLESKISQVMFEGNHIGYIDILSKKEVIIEQLDKITNMSDNEISYIKNFRKIKNIIDNEDGENTERCVELYKSFKTIWDNRELWFTGDMKPMKNSSLFPFQVLKDKDGNYNFYFLPKKSDTQLTQGEYFNKTLGYEERFLLKWDNYSNMIKTCFISEFDNSKHSTKIIKFREL